MCPKQVQETILKKKLKFYVIDGYAVARAAGMGSRINTIMQTCFFAISGVLPKDEAIAAIKKAIADTYGKRGDAVVQKNYAAVDQALANLHEVKVPDQITAVFDMLPAVSTQAPQFVRNVLGTIITGNGDNLPVSAMPVDGTFPTGTAMWEKRNIAKEIPVWDERLVHSVRKMRAGMPTRGNSRKGLRFVAAEGCTGDIQEFEAEVA